MEVSGKNTGVETVQGSGRKHKRKCSHKQNELASEKHAHGSADELQCGDSDIQKHFDLLKSSLQSRLRSVHEAEAASQKQEMLLQDRMEGLYDREQQVLEREHALLRQEQQVHAEQGRLTQLQSELQSQYTCLMTSLPLLQKRIAAARQSIPECAAAADSLNNSHTSLAMLSHQLLQQRSADPAQPSQADPQEANKPPYQCSDKAQDAQQLLHQTRIGPASLRSDASASHPSAAFLLARHKPGPASVQLGSNQTDAIPAAGHAAQAAAARNCAELVQPPAASAQEATASQSTVVVPPWECTGPAACADAGHPSEVSKQKHTVLSSELPTIHTTAAQAHFGRAAAAPAATLSSAIPVCVLPAMSKHTLSVPSVPLGKATASQHQSVETTSSHTNAVHAMPHTIAATASTPPMPVLNESHLNTPNPQQARGASKGPQPNQLGQTLCNGTSTKPRISAPDSKPAGHSATQPYFHPPTVKTRLAHAAGDSSSPKTSAIVASVSSPKASGSLDGLAVPMASSEMGSPSGSSRGRGRSFGRNRRGRGRPHISRPGDQALAGDLDEAVQALKATTAGTDSPRSNTDQNPQSASGTFTDDDLKPAFMRRLTSDKLPHPDGLTASDDLQGHGSTEVLQSGCVDINPRPATRRRLNPAATARKAVATAVLKSEAPDLLDLLQQTGLADDVDMLDAASNNPDEDEQQTRGVYDKMHAILSRVCEGKTGSSWQGRGLNAGKVSAADGEESKHEYCLLALEYLVERARAYSNNCEPVQWGWCRELTSFVFIFESANRIVVEKPNYGHATYFFDLEEPLPVADQVKRLIAVLSVPAVSRRKLLEGTSLDPGPDVTLQERKQLEAAGWKPGTTIRSLLNFSGDRIFHQSADIRTGQKLFQQYAPDYKEKIAKVLSEGASGGRITKAAHTG